MSEQEKKIEEIADYHITTATELVAALKAARPGQVVYIEDDVQLDLSGYENLLLSENITLASGGSMNGQSGALLYSNRLRTYPLFKTDGKNVRVTGLRIKGPDKLRRTKQMKQLLKRDQFYSLPNSRGIQVTHEGVEIDNCELSGWSHAAIVLFPGALNAKIHDNYIHHNQRHGLGYGIVLDQATALINNNFFDWNRHAISATGRPGTSYEARNNVVGENASSHAFDMHGGKDRKDGTNIAGTRIVIRNNKFYLKTHPAVRIRGRPLRRSYVHANCFSNLSLAVAIMQVNAKGNLEINANQLGGCATFQID